MLKRYCKSLRIPPDTLAGTYSAFFSHCNTSLSCLCLYHPPLPRYVGWKPQTARAICNNRSRQSFYFLTNVPSRYSWKAVRSSSCVFITMGPAHATGSPMGCPVMRIKRAPSFSVPTDISSRSARTRLCSPDCVSSLAAPAVMRLC